MIASLTGTLRALTADKAVIEVAGVGYSISITARTSSHLSVGSIVTLQTSLVVREDSLTLFGFLDMHERDIYETLQSVSGIGPKVALAITGVLTPDDLASAIAQEDHATIEKVPGIGKKGAQRLVLELKGKLSTGGAGRSSLSTHSSLRDQLLAALTGLGFTSKESDIAINSTLSFLSESGREPESYEISELLKLTLQSGKR